MIRVGIVGVGNVASMFIQGVEYYKKKNETLGLIHLKIGKYTISDIKFVYAVDISKNKVGKDLSEAIFAKPNLVPKITKLPKLNVEVSMGKILDGVASHMVEDFEPAKNKEPTLNRIVRELEDSNVDVLVNLLPVGSKDATRFYAKAATKANVTFVNGIPEFIASSSKYCKLFKESKAALLGDDIKGQLGATIVHRALASLIANRGAKLVESYQLNVGGNTDFKNMLDQSRLTSKKISKTKAVTSTQDEEEKIRGKVFAGPSGYIKFLKNTKIAYIYMRAKAFANTDVEIEVKLKVDDKAMAAPVLIDVVRLAKVLKDHEIYGCVNWASAFYFKHPPKPVRNDIEALKMLYENLEKLGETIEPKHVLH